MSATGSDQTTLIVLRGNSGAGKSTVAQALREAYGRGVAWVSQDLIRRTILREQDRRGASNIGLVDQVTRYSLEHGYHVILDGILSADRYGHMLADLRRDHRGRSCFFYLDVTLDESLRRHAARPQASEFGEDFMRGWYRQRDLLSSVRERVIPQTSTPQETIDVILAGSGLLQAFIVRAELAAEDDLPSWLELVAEVEPLFGPMPDFAAHAERGIGRGTALVVRDSRDVVLGAALLSGQPGAQPGSRPAEHEIRWLAVRSSARRRGVARALLTEIMRHWPAPSDIDVITFGAGHPGAVAARALYESFGLSPAEALPAGPESGSRQRFVLHRDLSATGSRSKQARR